MKLNKTILILIIILGGFFRFYKLDWGQGLFAHPDEYHIVGSVNQLKFPDQMNPHFFNYGTVVIYPIYFTKLLLPTTSFFLIGRFYSALYSTLSILLIYLICKRFLPEKYALLAAVLSAFTPGLIQQAHFLTPESAMIFFILASLLFILYFVQKPILKWLFYSSLCIGLALGVKISSVFFLPVILIAIIIKFWHKIYKIFIHTIIFSITALATFFVGAPFVFLDYSHFNSSFQYEESLAAGRIMVFYTRQFIDTVPVLFQLQKIYPYALGPALMLFGLAGFFLMLFLIFRDKKYRLCYLLLAACYLLLFLPNAFLFTKWTRFSSPTFPFFAIFAAFLLYKFSLLKLPKIFSLSINYFCLILTVFSALAFFSIYIRHDIRITADKWMGENTPAGSTFFVEEGNTVEVPLQGNFKVLKANFYNLEESPSEQQKITSYLARSDYFIVESRRIFANHQRLPNMFPKTAKFYNTLFSGNLGFKEIKTFTSFPLVPDEQAEETWSVFDHPVIRVFKRI